MVLSIIFLEDKHKIVLHLSIFYEYCGKRLDKINSPWGNFLKFLQDLTIDLKVTTELYLILIKQHY
jgi:hypothetical protein